MNQSKEIIRNKIVCFLMNLSKMINKRMNKLKNKIFKNKIMRPLKIFLILNKIAFQMNLKKMIKLIIIK